MALTTPYMTLIIYNVALIWSYCICGFSRAKTGSKAGELEGRQGKLQKSVNKKL